MVREESTRWDNGPILIISGTNRPGSNALRVARVLEAHYRAAGAPVEVLSLVDLPAEMFHPTAYAQKPAGVIELQRRILDARGLHIVTPEYNGSFPGVLKYFIDMLKFPESFEAKPVAFTAISGGLWGGLRPVGAARADLQLPHRPPVPDRVSSPASTRSFDAGVGQVH
jgi:NAD(P)H-dependent FMN reductase